MSKNKRKLNLSANDHIIIKLQNLLLKKGTVDHDKEGLERWGNQQN